MRVYLLVTQEGFSLTELDSVPGGVGLTAYLNRLYENSGATGIIGEGGAMEEAYFAQAAAASLVLLCIAATGLATLLLIERIGRPG